MKDACGYGAVFAQQGASSLAAGSDRSLGCNYQTPCHGGSSQRRSSSLRTGARVGSTRIACECQKQPQVWIIPPPSRRPTQRDSMKEPVVLLERNLYGHPLAGLLG